jgi:MFS family permease
VSHSSWCAFRSARAAVGAIDDLSRHPPLRHLPSAQFGAGECWRSYSEIVSKRGVSPGSMVLPLALAQFVASYAASNMNVAISTIADDIGTTVIGMQTTITLFTLTMAALMIPGSKLTDIWGRKTCLLAGLVVYGSGALLAAFAQGLTLMIIGYSVLQGVGSALMIPPIYILITVAFTDTGSRAKYFGVVSGAAGLGSAAGPLIGGPRC